MQHTYRTQMKNNFLLRSSFDLYQYLIFVYLENFSIKYLKKQQKMAGNSNSWQIREEKFPASILSSLNSQRNFFFFPNL